jgi:hypothetical protein
MSIRGISTAAGEAGGLSDTDEQAIIEGLAHSAVEKIAPEELPLFGPTSEAYFDPARGTPAGAKSDEMLGFGVDAAAAMMLVTPVALEAAKSVVGYVVGELQSALKDEAGPMIQAFAKRLLHGGAKPAGSPEGKGGEEAGGQVAAKPAADEPLPFSQVQLDELHKVALKTAERMGMERDKASVVADAIVGAIVR